MDVRGGAPPPDGLLAAIASRQAGVVARRQLLALGLGRGAIEKRLAVGRLHRVHRGVYAVGHPALSRTGRLMAAVLACPRGVLSHRSAAELWGIGPQARPIEVTAPGARRVAGIRIHRGLVPPTERTTIAGVVATTPGRTIVDLADVVGRRGVERAIDQAEYLRLDCAGLAVIPGRRGSGTLGAILASHVAESTRTASPLEERFLAFCDTHGLPRPEVNAYVDEIEVDFLWRSAWLIVENDGRAAHLTRRAFEADRRRDADLMVAGYRVYRVTDRALATEPLQVARRLRQMLALGEG